jgi:hypothetical protein
MCVNKAKFRLVLLTFDKHFRDVLHHYYALEMTKYPVLCYGLFKYCLCILHTFRTGDFTSMSCNYIKWKQETVNKVRVKETNLRNYIPFSAVFKSKYVKHCMGIGSVLPNL